MKGQDVLLLYKLVSLEQGGFDPDTASTNSFLIDAGSEERGGAEILYGQTDRVSPYSVRSLATATGIGKTEVAKALSRCQASGLLAVSQRTSFPRVNVRGLEEFSVYGLRYVFPASRGRVCRGMQTGLTTPIFGTQLLGGGDMPPVWADPLGEIMGMEISPLFKSVPLAAKRDERLYRYLALLDSLRMGQAREVKLAAVELARMLKADR